MRKDSISPVQSLNLAARSDEVDLLHLVGTLWRGKWRILLVMMLAVLLAGVYAFVVAVPKYSSTAVVALESRDSQVVDFESVVSGLSADTATINTEVEVLRARILLGKLVDALGLMEDPEFNEELRPANPWSVKGILRGIGLASDPVPLDPQAARDAVVDELLGSIGISNIRNSYVFRISAVTQDPLKSSRIADRLADLYITDQLTTKFEATEQATSWLTERVSELKIELEEAETAVKDYNSSIDLIGPEALAALNRQLKDIRLRLTNSERDLAGHETRIAAMERARDADDVAAMGVAAADDVLATAAARASTDQGARSIFMARFNELLARVRVARDREAAQAAALAKSVSDIEARVEAQSADLVRLQQLEREASASGLIYEYFLSRLKETSVQQGIQQADARVLSYAVVADSPSEPRKPIMLVTAAFLGLFLGSVLVLVREMRQNGFRSAEDMERITGVTVIGQIPRAPSGRRRKLLDYIVSKPTSALVESVRNLRTSILLSDPDKPPQVIMLTSSVPGEGKTTQSLALAHNLSGLGRKVLIVEGDIRRRTFREYFEIPEERGLVSAVTGEAKLADIVWREETLGIDILIGENTRLNAADFFSSDKFAAFLKAARKAYDVILIDTPPVLVVPDARVIAQQSDAVVYVVHWDKTPRSQVEQGLHAFSTVNAPVTGLVLSQIDPKGMKRYGGRYGEAYSAYGAKYYGN